MPGPERLPEAIRNRLLRRVDWRFLLADPTPARSICFTDGQLADAVALISGQVVEAGAGLSSDCDLTVAVNPSPATLSAAWRALRPGGICYTEWWSPATGGARGVRRRLKTAGFDEPTCYSAWPPPVIATPRFWVPLGATGAMHYF